jgi:hypothetical protein
MLSHEIIAEEMARAAKAARRLGDDRYSRFATTHQPWCGRGSRKSG